jgi:hypothetical protein
MRVAAASSTAPGDGGLQAASAPRARVVEHRAGILAAVAVLAIAAGGTASPTPRTPAAARFTSRQSVLAGLGLSLAAMGGAAAGYLPPLAGARLQEGIDLAVILNALRALR